MRRSSLRPQYSRLHSSSSSSSSSEPIARAQIALLVITGAFFILLCWYFYLQIICHEYYNRQAQQQYQRLVNYEGERGKIYSSEGNLLVGNHQLYQLYLEPSAMTLSWEEAYQLISPIVLADPEASASLKPLESARPQLISKKDKPNSIVAIANYLSQSSMTAIDALEIDGVQFQSHLTRFYPEKTMAAQTLGFLSKDKNEGNYGIEGGLDKELASKSSQMIVSNSVYQNQNLITENLDGRDIYLTLRKDVQILLESSLAKAMKTYGAARGEIIVMEPSTGKILGLATSPSYDPDKYYEYDASLYKNPAVIDLYEPGSTFKVITVAAGIDSKVISPDTQCPKCYGPRVIDKYTLRTWDNVYHPKINMTEALEKSDNVAMIYVTDLLGGERFKNYLQAFGIGEPLNLGTQEDTPSSFPQDWGPVEIATRSYGQGVTVSSLQLMRAVGAIANHGEMMQPYLVEKAVDPTTGEVFVTQPQSLRQVISTTSAATVSKMMQQAAQHGEAQYVYKNTRSIAGKTGTAQIPEAGGYEENATIASFIGFAPYDDPQFLMLVKFERPQSSPWAAETAAPTFKEISEKLLVILGIQGDLETDTDNDADN